MFERFTAAARSVVVHAQEEARALRHGWIGTEHLLIGLADDPGVAGVVLADAGVRPEDLREALRTLLQSGGDDAEALRTLGIDLDDVRRSVEEAFGEGALEDRPSPGRWRRRSAMPSGHIPFTGRAKKALELALREAVHLNSASIGSEHLLLGILRENGGVGLRLLTDAGVDPVQLRDSVLERLRRTA